VFEFRIAALTKRKEYAIMESVLEKGNFMNVFIYVLDTLADWEISYLMAEINSGRYLKKNIEKPGIIKVGKNLKPIKSWYNLYKTKESKYFFELMESIK
jgi:hypothetical protein